MKHALLIGYFTDNGLIREAYNSMQVEFASIGYSMEGIQPEGSIASGYDFPAYSFGIVPSRHRHSKIRRLFCLIPYLLPFRKEQSYAEMQSQGASYRGLLKCLEILNEFRNHLQEVIRTRKIAFVILNHQFSGFHLIARDVCLRERIPFVFWHPGFLPGTMSFDREGQMAESEINAIMARELIACGAEEQELGERYRKWCRSQAYVRPGKTASSNISSLNELLEIKARFKNILLVIGSNDYRTGMLPVSYPNSSKHSPVIHSSKDLLNAIVSSVDESICILYKPHPNLNPTTTCNESTDKRCRIVYDVTIRDLLPHVDAVVTLVSAAAFEALIFGIPAVVVGNLPGSDLGICYKPSPEKFDLSETVNKALASGMQPNMEKRMNILMGYLLKNYFFAAGSAACPLVKKTLRDSLGEVLRSVL
jgi:hypothetical protein